MRKIIEIPMVEISPSIESILSGQGINKYSDIDHNLKTLALEAQDCFEDYAQPIGIIDEISIDEFEKIYFGSELNDTPAPIENIYPRAKYLALFAVTVGENVCHKISDLFDNHDYPSGSMLDSAASVATDTASEYLCDWFRKHLVTNNKHIQGNEVLGYSPGYCGWHVSAQKALFARLKPEEIGITLRESSLMEPLKSISGVFIYGEWDIHIFENDFMFCGQCPSQTCVQRIESLKINYSETQE